MQSKAPPRRGLHLVGENGSGGTDHGAAGVGFLVGTRAKGRMVGEFPDLQDDLDEDGTVKATADFRGVYAALREQWLGTDAGAVIPDAARSRGRRSSAEPRLSGIVAGLRVR